MKIFENENLEIYEYLGEGYEPTMHYGAWRVAFLNYTEKFDKITYLERHLRTDEVFVLLSGKAKLILGADKQVVTLETGKIYNVRRAAWHAIKASPDAHVLIVENHDTSRENSEYMHFEAPLQLEL